MLKLFTLRSAFSSVARRWKSTLVVVEHADGKLVPSTLNAVTAASKFGEVTCLVAGQQCTQVAEQVGKVEGVKKVLLAESDVFKGLLPEAVTTLVVDVQKQHQFSHILADASSFGKSVIPCIAAKLDVAAVSDIISVKSDDTFVRTIYAGNAVQTVKSLDAVKLITVRSTAFEAAPVGASAATTESGL